MSVVAAPEERHSFLDRCLVEGNSDQELRVRRNKRHALLISIVFEILIVAALVLFPLLSHGERVSISDHFTIFPPYFAGSSHAQKDTTPHTRRENHPACHFCAPPRIPQGIITRDSSRATQTSDDNLTDSDVSRAGSPEGNPFVIPDPASERGPARPKEGKETTEPTKRIHVGTMEPAMLIHRVEPSYPPLGRQLRHEGRVELHALIATDGTIQSLEVISGDPLFIRSALDAVREWRYRPTILNGQPVEVDTHITVVYTLSH
jgi:protein TonB